VVGTRRIGRGRALLGAGLGGVRNVDCGRVGGRRSLGTGQ
jgi:hypothetical protein